jgi:hypothetical protein
MILEKPDFLFPEKTVSAATAYVWLLKSLIILLDRWCGKMMLRLPMGLSGLLDGLSPTGTTQAQNGRSWLCARVLGAVISYTTTLLAYFSVFSASHVTTHISPSVSLWRHLHRRQDVHVPAAATH